MNASPERLTGFVVITLALLLAATNAAGATWSVPLAANSAGQAAAASGPAVPAGVAATCTSSTSATVDVGWNPVANATSYTIWQSTTSATSGYAIAASNIAGTSWTSGSLATGTYWFEVSAAIGANWTSPTSSATAQRTILVAACA